MPASPEPNAVVDVCQLLPLASVLSSDGSLVPRVAPAGMVVAHATESTLAPDPSRSATQSDVFARLMMAYT